MLRKKRGQGGMEYIVIILIVIVLIIPFAYKFYIVGTKGGFSTQVNNDAVIRVAAATKTIAFLGGPASKMSVPVRIRSLKKNHFNCGNLVSVTNSNGEEFYAKGSPTICSSLNTLTGSGVYYVPITKTYRGGVVVGDGPAIVEICKEEVELENIEFVDESSCGHLADVTVEKDFKIVGANFIEGIKVYIDKISNKWKEIIPPGELPSCDDPMVECLKDSQCFTNEICTDMCTCAEHMPIEQVYVDGEGAGLVLTVGNQQTGVGTYAVQLVGPDDERSTSYVMRMVPAEG